MPRFEGGGRLWWKVGEKSVEQGEIFLEIRRQLEQQGAELVAERACYPTKSVDELAAVLQTTVVGDTPRRFERDLVRLRCLSSPTCDQLFVRHPVKRVIDLDGRKPGGIVRQHLRRGQIRRIEAALPFGVVVTGGANPDHVEGLSGPVEEITA